MIWYNNIDAVKAFQTRIAEDFAETKQRRGLRLVAASDHAAR